MHNEDEEGLVLEYLEDLIFYDDRFVYGEDCNYLYEDIDKIKYTANVVKKSVNLIATGTDYKTYLCLYLADGCSVNIDQEHSFFGIKEKQKAEAVMRASAIFHEISFTHRIEKYEKQLKTKGFVSWGEYQFSEKGEFFKNYELLFNLRDQDVTKTLNVFSLQVSKKSKNLKESLFKLWKSHEVIDISIDRDCFLYFMKNYLGLMWKDEVVKEKKKPTKSEFYEAVVVLGAKVCKADGRVDVIEIKTFKTYFGIDEKSFPDSAEIFRKAAISAEGVQEPAQKIYALFEGQQEPLEYIVIGLIKIAAADGIITDQERNLVESVCRVFQFTNYEIERLFLIFENIRQQNKGASNNNFSYQTRAQYLKILGLDAHAAHDEVKTAYKELVRKHHPDILFAQGVPVERIKDSEEILKTINSAYNWLCSNENDKKRAAS